VWFAQAASPASSIVMIEPARILDTRETVDLGLAGPFTSPTPQDVQVTGPIPTARGTATVVPAGATGVLLNVTPVNSSAGGFISVRPANASGTPTTSSLNFEAGAINPNSVQVELPTSGADAGKIEISYDAFGQNGPTTDVLVDVVGYTLAAGSGGGDPALAARVAALEAANTAQAAAIAALQSDAGSMQWDIAALEDAQPFAVTARDDNEAFTAPESIVSISLTAPVAGQVTVVSSVEAFESDAGDRVNCSINNAASMDDDYTQGFESSTPNGSGGHLAGVRTFSVAEGQAGIYRLVCERNPTVGPGASSVFDSVITAVFTPAP
jgi:hypothetical protein